MTWQKFFTGWRKRWALNDLQKLIFLFARPTNLHKSKSHIQLLWTLNEHAPEEKQLLP
jgi:hypothetical protein